MGLKTFIRNWLKVERCDNYLNNYKKCICDDSVILEPTSLIENYFGIKSIKIGSKTRIQGHLMTTQYGGEIIIGHDCFVGRNSRIWSVGKIELGNHVLIAHNTNIFDNNTHPIDPILRRTHMTDWNNEILNADLFSPKPVKICDDAWIGCNCVILKGVTIGEAAIVGAGSVVTHDVEPYTIVAGNPAKIIKRIKH